ncbi:MAG: 3-deoxy-7-phosphoheptulonate synthase, partial [Umezawaea sp.]
MLTRSASGRTAEDAAPDVRQAGQQPRWPDAALAGRVRRQLAALPGLVELEHVLELRAQLAVVAAGEAGVVQAGDCAEDPAECGPGDVARKSGLLEVLAGRMKLTTGKPVLRAGRLAGQFAKPRSSHTERVGDLELPSYRGHMVNAPEPTPQARRPDPTR